MLREHLLERLTINRPLIEERPHHYVSELLLETVVLERAATQIPIRLGHLRVREHLTTLIAHKLVIDLPKPT